MSEVTRTIEAMQAYAITNSELGRVFARSRHMHTTDASAVVEILIAEQRGRPITPARLAERLALTTGATSTLLNRLEDAGHIRRTREHADRRVVTVHSTPEIHASADAFFAPLGEQLAAAVSDFSAADLAVVAAFTERLHTATTAYIDGVEHT